MKLCKDCKHEKPLSCFYKSHGPYYQPRCKPCHSIRTKRWYSEHPEKRIAADRKYRFKRVYGITPEQYLTRLEAQQHRCAICFAQPDPTLHVDHCHKTGKVRGLLCGLCNTGLGHFRDNPTLLQTAVGYLASQS